MTTIMTIEVPNLVFPPYSEFMRGANIRILDYEICFSSMIVKTELGELHGNRKFHVIGSGISQDLAAGVDITEENYERAQKEILDSRMSRIKELL